MSFDDYAHHIYQKYRLSIALAILKTKPPDLNVTDYIEQLKSNMADKMDMDDVTICSDDFNMSDDDSVAILNDFKDFGDDNVDLREHDFGEQMAPNLPEDPSQSTHCSRSQSQLPNTSQATTTYYENDHSNQQFFINEIPPKRTKTAKKKVPNNFETKNSQNIKGNLIKTANTDSQKTVLYTVPGLTQNCTHYSASQNKIDIPTNHLFAENRYKDVFSEININEAKETNNAALNTTYNNDIYSQNDIFYDEIQPKDNNLNIQIVKASDVLLKNIKTSEVSKDNEKENTFSQNLDELLSRKKVQTENQTDVSKDLSQDLDDYFKEIRHLNNTNELLEQNVAAENEELMPEIDEVYPSIPNYYQDVNNFAKETTNLNVTITNITEIHPKTTNFTQNNNNFEDVNINLKAKVQEINKICPNTANFDTKTTNLSRPDAHVTKNMENFDAEVKFSQQIDDFDMIEDAAEIIPYKVLEELNKIKMFLRRGDRRMSSDHSDSGYRSDSQRSLKRSFVQSTGMSMNESAYCLLNHILQSPLKEATADITMEIAQTLGHLINRLHGDETYPPFLEEMLDTVDILLRQVYKGQSSEHNEFLKKEDFIQRILLLNKSIHIQRHTIEKICNILAKFHEQITDQNNMFEINNINEIENASFIFHILELIIKKYIKNKNDLPLTTSQLSQDEARVLKKSSITDIWRKKWNPNLKEKTGEGRSEKVCVLKNCSEILNKIVVDCVNSFSLVSYAALKCFNAIQS